MAIVGDHAPPDVVASRSALELGLDRPLLVQFGIYLVNLAHGDLGRSVMTSHTVVDDIAHFFPATWNWRPPPIIVAVADRRAARRAGRGAAGHAHRPRASACSAWPANRCRSSCSRCWRCWSSTPRSAGRPAPAGRTCCSRAGAGRDRPAHRRLRCSPATGTRSTTRSRISRSPPACSPISAWPTSPA